MGRWFVQKRDWKQLYLSLLLCGVLKIGFQKCFFGRHSEKTNRKPVHQNFEAELGWPCCTCYLFFATQPPSICRPPWHLSTYPDQVWLLTNQSSSCPYKPTCSIALWPHRPLSVVPCVNPPPHHPHPSMGSSSPPLGSGKYRLDKH